MKLLDEPIYKEAEISNKEALVKMLMGTGIGAGAGALGEYLTTGKFGWTGGLVGALLGTGTAAYLNPEARKKLISTIKGRTEEEGEPTSKPSEDTEVVNEEKAAEIIPTDRQYYNQFKELLNSDYEIPDEQRRGMQEYVANYDQYLNTVNTLNKDPKFSKVLEEARSGSYFDQISPGDDPDYSEHVYHYAKNYTREMGKSPTPEHLLRFARQTRAGALVPEEWGAYMTDKHYTSGDEEYPVSAMALQLGGGQVAGRLSKPTIERLMKTKGGQKVLEKTFGKGVTNKGWRKLMFGKGGKLTSAKMAGKAAPGFNILLDIPEFVIDPNTGEYTRNVGKNISEQDRLMELREQGGDMTFLGLEHFLPDWKTPNVGGHELRLRDIQNSKRNTPYNIYAGAMRGWFNPLTSLAIGHKRSADTMGEYGRNVANRGVYEGGKSNIQSGASALAQTAAEYYHPVADLFTKKKIKDPKFTWGADVQAPTRQELEALRDRIANRRGYYEVDGKRIPIQEYHKKYRK
jgi:hypothetical protein